MSAEPVVRIVGGELTDDGLAALTSVLIALVAVDEGATAPHLTHRNGHRRAGWRRLEWDSTYRSPSSWR